MTLANLLTDATSVLTNAITNAGNLVTFVTSSPLLYVPCLFGIALFGVHIVKSFIQR